MNAQLFTLAANEVHVWSFALERSAAEIGHEESALSPDERGRANAFRFPRDRAGFVIAHGVLRRLLGGYLRCAPAEVRFVIGLHGKPRLAEEVGGDVRFNLSHSHGQAMVAVACGCDIGVDLEQMRPEVDCAEIVASHFSPAERAAWVAWPEAMRRAAFFHGWVRKEAYVKARGDGLSHPSSAYTVELDPQGAGGLLADSTELESPARWSLHAITGPVGYAAAVAYAGSPRTVQHRGI